MIRFLLHTLRVAFTALWIQMLLFVALAIWSQWPSSGEIPDAVLEHCFRFYAPGIEIVQGITPEAWWSGEGALLPYLAISCAIILYAAVLGLAAAVVSLAVRTIVKKAAKP